MTEQNEFQSLQELLDRLQGISQNDEDVSVGEIIDMVGDRSYGPLLLISGLLTLAPIIGDIPGVPTILGAIVFLFSVQLLFGKEHFWLPKFLLERSVSGKKMNKGIEWLQSPARWIDKLLKPRLRLLVKDTAVYIIAFMCLMIASVMPIMELVPFSANAAGAALTVFGLALIARDGLLLVLALILTGVIAAIIINVL
ncbi:exopolysaccharide biosynthesis protein [Rhodohalobacter sp.]|uniref:exopolysaccharide biosynthesis protein n=1 Tax=Rhodohalobacter sp. TaxID=1974210 RepID=UPI002ACDF70C|nr:exopolysaccharide biosynthesis protein [Rhodohalobacter sp.]MDZ7756543.1 exopolysaccharide biosynthesis protein [Rhodohalobacter sp.]